MEKILSSIRKPADIRRLDLGELEILAQECRETIIKTVSENGGHLASNLGVVELTLALAKTFQFEEGHDRLIFDVGHQSYCWKLISGRTEQFSRIRLKDGLSGFPKREESPYDFFNTGHSSTSISAAVGFARADRLAGRKRNTIAMIGDGALGGGMAFEALNDAGQRKEPLLIIINDNQKSIDDNVGALSKHLERLRISEGYRRLKSRMEPRLSDIPVFGKLLLRSLRKLKSFLRRWKREDGIFFEQLGFRYYGPIDGHDFEALLRHLEALRDLDEATILHVMTKKGHGYAFAENEPSRYHGVAPFEMEAGLSADSPARTYTAAAGSLAVSLAEKDPRVCAISAAMTGGTGLSEFAARFPDRFFDVGIAEQHAVTLAAGLAASGMRPLVALYSTFSQRAMDQILHDVCLQNLPVLFLIDRAGLVPADGETHQGIYDLSMMLSMPNLRIFSPWTEADLENCMRGALNEAGPVLIRYPKDELPQNVDLGKDSDLYQVRKLRSGGDLSILAHGCMSGPALESAALLVQNDLEADVLSCICSNYAEKSVIIESVRTTGRLLILEDGAVRSGFGSAILPELIETLPQARFKLLGVKAPVSGQGSRSELMEAEGLDAEGIREAVLHFMQNLDRKEGSDLDTFCDLRQS